jgi:hypothetical protein
MPRRTLDLRHLASRLLFAFVLAISLDVAPHTLELSAANTGPQVLLLGDRICGDVYSPCTFPNVTTHHRYLHVVLHEYPGDVEWHVQAGTDCLFDLNTVASGGAVGSDGWGEFVIDLLSTDDGQHVVGGPSCYLLRGLHGYGATFYAAYFDDSPQPDADTLYPNYRAMNGRPYLPDLDVQVIHRSPVVNFDATPNHPRIGSPVTYTASLANVGALPTPPFTYQWLLDGAPVSSGSQPALVPGAAATIAYGSVYDGRPHTLRLQTTVPGNQIATANDTLSIRTDAITLGFWVEQSALRYFDDHQWAYCIPYACTGSDSFADWVQRQVANWNRMFASSRSIYAPDGVIDRVRLDEIVVVPDGLLPLHGGLATNDPDFHDHTVDLEWGLPADGVVAAFPTDTEGPFDRDDALLHELSHARSLTDLYRYDIPMDAGDTIDVHGADGIAVFDPSRPFAPANKLRAFSADAPDYFLFRDAERDLMTCICSPFYSAYDAVVLNRIQGQRARCGNTNPPCTIGNWFADLPPVVRLHPVDPTGAPVPDGSTVHLFFDAGTSYAGHIFTQGDSLTLTVENGDVELPPDPFHTGGRSDDASHNDLLIEVTSPADDAFCFLEPTALNLAYWTGYRTTTQPATFILTLGGTVTNGCNLQPPAILVNAPFSTSPWLSSYTVTNGTGGKRVARVHLRDGGHIPVPMHDRTVDVYAGATSVGTGTTDASGSATITLRAGKGTLHVVDRTDNNLTIMPPATAHPVRPVHSR